MESERAEHGPPNPVGPSEAVGTAQEATVSVPEAGTAQEHPAEHVAPQGESLSALLVLEAWRTFDLDTRRSEMDAAALAIAEKQNASLKARKMLAESTRALKRTLNSATECPPDLSKAVIALLKEYQGEIDALTGRAKFVEAEYYSVYRSMYELPNPVDGLEQELRNELRIFELQDQLAAAHKEVVRVDQMNSRVSENQEMIREYEKQMSAEREELVQQFEARVTQMRADWINQREAEMQAWRIKENELLARVSEERDEQTGLRKQNEQLRQELTESKSKLSVAKALRMNELERTEEELMRSRAEVTSLRHRVRHFESEGGAVVAQQQLASASNEAERLRIELASKDVLIVGLQEQLQTLMASLQHKDASGSLEFKKLTDALAQRNAKIAQLEDQLRHAPSKSTYERMKVELEAMQSMHFELTKGSDHFGPTGGADDSSPYPSIEQRLTERVKLLDGKLAHLRNENLEKSAQLEDAKRAVEQLTESLEDQQVLVARLENSISKMTLAEGSPGDSDTKSSRANRNKSELAWDEWGGETIGLLDRESLASGAVATATHKSNVSSVNTPEREPSMLDIVSGQRDRFRARVRELEQENHSLAQRLDEAKREIESVKSDSVVLFQKLKYVQNYQQQGGYANASSASRDEEMGGASNFVVDKYERMYESSGNSGYSGSTANPYALFNRAERQRRLNEMNVADRFTLRAGEQLMSNRNLRMFTFFYMILLHVFVFLFLNRIRYCHQDLLQMDAASLHPQAAHRRFSG
ncbi:Protein CASP [Porphyridium purpureum]|uniref:Protein CASP n=1 Tax=Porphyridium purpureum TaxID=35688 RepID=A0A5J4YYB8_PORPP|nr:Protein CASP [Porphyridium purpureum]|eukprot:POR7292..scf209_3